MNCYACATHGHERPAVGLCQHCLVGLCLEHLRETQRPGPGGVQLGCRHGLVTPGGSVGTGARGRPGRRAIR